MSQDQDTPSHGSSGNDGPADEPNPYALDFGNNIDDYSLNLNLDDSGMEATRNVLQAQLRQWERDDDAQAAELLGSDDFGAGPSSTSANTSTPQSHDSLTASATGSNGSELFDRWIDSAAYSDPPPPVLTCPTTSSDTPYNPAQRLQDRMEGGIPLSTRRRGLPGSSSRRNEVLPDEIAGSDQTDDEPMQSGQAAEEVAEAVANTGSEIVPYNGALQTPPSSSSTELALRQENARLYRDLEALYAQFVSANRGQEMALRSNQQILDMCQTQTDRGNDLEQRLSVADRERDALSTTLQKEAREVQGLQQQLSQYLRHTSNVERSLAVARRVNHRLRTPARSSPAIRRARTLEEENATLRSGHETSTSQLQDQIEELQGKILSLLESQQATSSSNPLSVATETASVGPSDSDELYELPSPRRNTRPTTPTGNTPAVSSSDATTQTDAAQPSYSPPTSSEILAAVLSASQEATRRAELECDLARKADKTRYTAEKRALRMDAEKAMEELELANEKIASLEATNAATIKARDQATGEAEELRSRQSAMDQEISNLRTDLETKRAAEGGAQTVVEEATATADSKVRAAAEKINAADRHDHDDRVIRQPAPASFGTLRIRIDDLEKERDVARADLDTAVRAAPLLRLFLTEHTRVPAWKRKAGLAAARKRRMDAEEEQEARRHEYWLDQYSFVPLPEPQPDAASVDVWRGRLPVRR